MFWLNAIGFVIAALVFARMALSVSQPAPQQGQLAQASRGRIRWITKLIALIPVLPGSPLQERRDGFLTALKQVIAPLSDRHCGNLALPRAAGPPQPDCSLGQMGVLRLREGHCRYAPIETESMR